MPIRGQQRIFVRRTNLQSVIDARRSQVLCISGHDDWYVYRDSRGRMHRQCRSCKRERMQIYRSVDPGYGRS